MDQSVNLAPLVCLKCSAPIPADPEQVAWVCQVCGQGMHLDDTQGLQPLEVHYSSAIALNMSGRPHWVTDGQVSLQRETYGGSRGAEAEGFWSAPRRFIIPAYQAPLEELLAQASNFLLKPPTLQDGPPAGFQPPTLRLEDVKSAAEFIVMAIEAGRADKLKKLGFQMKLTRPVLWILP